MKLKFWVVTYKTGEKSHATIYKPGQCFGCASSCRMGPYDVPETSRTKFTGKNFPTCKSCTKLIRQLLPVIDR